MVFQSVPETAEIVIAYVQNGSQLKTVLQARLVGGYDLADLTALAVGVDAAVAASWLPIQTVDVTYISTTVRGLEFVNDEEVVNTTSAGNGGSAAAGLPSNVTLSVKKLSGLTGRSARGRIYWIGLTTAMLSANENIVSASQADAIVTAIEAMVSAINTTAWIAVILSRVSGGVPRVTGETFGWTNTAYANNNVDSQRRRLL